MPGGADSFAEPGVTDQPDTTPAPDNTNRNLRIVEGLSKAAGGFFQDRAQGKANKRAAKSNASANLINALRGNFVARGQSAVPGSSTGASIFNAIGNIAQGVREGGETDANMQLKRDTLAARNAPKPGKPTDLSNVYRQAGALKATKGKVTLDQIQNDPLSTMGQHNRTQLMRFPVNQRQPLIAEYIQGFLSAFEQPEDPDTPDPELNDVTNLFKQEGRAYRPAPGETEQEAFDRMYQQILERQAQGAALPSEGELRGAWLEGRNKAKEFDASGRVPFKTVELGAEELGADDLQATVVDLINNEPTLKAYMADPRGAASVFAVHRALIRGQKNEVKRLAEKSELQSWAKAELVEVNSGLAKVAGLEKRFLELSIKGPIAGNVVPIFQLFSPNEAAYDKARQTFAVDLARAINGGRPSDKDAAAILKMIPDRADTDVTAQLLFDHIREIIAAKREAVLNEFDIPLHEYMSKDGFNREAWTTAVNNRILSEGQAADMWEAINNKKTPKNLRDHYEEILIEKRLISKSGNTLMPIEGAFDPGAARAASAASNTSADELDEE